MEPPEIKPRNDRCYLHTGQGASSVESEERNVGFFEGLCNGELFDTSGFDQWRN